MTATENAPQDRYAFGAHVKLRWPGRTSLTPAQWWSGFDDYLSLQKVLANHTNTRLETGAGQPANGIGATIAFDFMGGVTREVLVEKDDVSFVWKISMPEPNALFTFYEGTARIDASDATGCDVSYGIDVVLASQDEATRRSIIDQPTPPGPTRVDELARLVLERDGLSNTFTFPVATDIDSLWAVVGNWRDVSWVQGAKEAELSPPDRRTIYFADGSKLSERMWSCDTKTHTLVYEPLDGPMPVRMYLGTLSLQSTGTHKTQVTYKQTFIAKDGMDPVQVKTSLASAFRQRFAWVQQRFAAK